MAADGRSTPAACYNGWSMTPSAAPVPVAIEVEAARYALLRRLAPSMRHHLVVNLQPIGMIYEVMDRRLKAPAPDLAHVQDSAGKINGFAKAALASCVDVVSWLAPDDSAGIAVPEAARECATLLATSLSFRGYALRNEVGEMPGLVRRAAIRHLLAGTLLHCTDRLPAPAELVLTAQPEPEGVLIRVTVRPIDGEQGMGTEANYRRITWADVQALAAAEGVPLVREADSLMLRLPWRA
jgi:hypothetical protein